VLTFTDHFIQHDLAKSERGFRQRIASFVNDIVVKYNFNQISAIKEAYESTR